MNLQEVLVIGYYDEDNGKDYIIEVKEDLLKKWLKKEKFDLIDYDKDIAKKIEVCNILQEEFTKKLSHYSNFTVKFI